jgi:hypothetical protein
MRIDDVERLDSLRYHAVGNAVSVPVTTWLGNRIRAAMESADEAPSAIASATAAV